MGNIVRGYCPEGHWWVILRGVLSRGTFTVGNIAGGIVQRDIGG